jgi:hypothetical protein
MPVMLAYTTFRLLKPCFRTALTTDHLPYRTAALPLTYTGKVMSA